MKILHLISFNISCNLIFKNKEINDFNPKINIKLLSYILADWIQIDTSFTDTSISSDNWNMD